MLMETLLDTLANLQPVGSFEWLAVKPREFSRPVFLTFTGAAFILRSVSHCLMLFTFA